MGTILGKSLFSNKGVGLNSVSFVLRCLQLLRRWCLFIVGAIERRNHFQGVSANSSPHRKDHHHQHMTNTASPHGRLHGGYSEIRDNNEIGPRRIRDDIPDSDLIDYEDEGEGESLLGW